MASRGEEMARACRERLVESVRQIWKEEWGDPPAEDVGIVLSGGVDTCAVAEALKEVGVKPRLALTVYADPSATDRPYAPLIASQHGMEHVEIEVALDELLAEPLELCVRVLHSFDGMELRNSIVVARAMMEAKKLGIKYLLTGDASDELMGGYSFTWGTEDPTWTQKRNWMCGRWFFSGPHMAEALGLKVAAPYMHPTFKDWALSTLGKDDCVGERMLELKPGDERELRKTGKVPLREAFPEALAAWRRKDPIEVGSGSTVLGANNGAWFKDRVGEQAFEEERLQAEKEYSLKIRDPEHLTYFRAFQRVFPGAVAEGKEYPGLPRRALDSPGSCVGCHFELPDAEATFCKVCGQWPARKQSPA